MPTRKPSHFAIALLPMLLAACASTQPQAPAEQSKQAVTAQGSRPVASVGHGNDIGEYIQAMDANQDGAVTAEEVRAQRMEHFQRVDANGDGKIDIQEYVGEFRQRLQAGMTGDREEIDRMTLVRFQSLAGEGQSHVSRSRYDQAGERAYAAFAQGKLPEKSSAGKQGQGHAQGEKGQQGQGRQRPSMLAMPTNHNKAGMMALYDLNRDGQLTREEFDKVREEQFKRTDINGDGRLSLGEYATEFDLRIDARLSELMARQMTQARVRFGILDADKSDFLEAEEFVQSGMRMFQRVDRNSDGRVDQVDASLPAPKRGEGAARQQEGRKDPAKAK
ncbi:MAG: hypothetical protein Q4A97_01995 [Comamonadaceae bacterium]|nr:hypothetical protein [Comamonadaceae bacterium]